MAFEREMTVGTVSADLYGTEFVSLSWEVKPIRPSGTYAFNVYRSFTNSIDDAKLVQSLGATNTFTDYDIKRRDKTESIWYWVGLNKIGVSGEDLYGPKKREVDASREALKIRADENMLLTLVLKNESLMYIKRRFGQICTCSVDGGVTPDSSCGICYGTGYVGGYSGAVSGYVGISMESSYHASSTGITEKMDTLQGWTTYGPSLQSGDLIFIKPKDTLYLISSPTRTTLHGVVLRQIFAMSEVPRGHVAYNLIGTELSG